MRMRQAEARATQRAKELRTLRRHQQKTVPLLGTLVLIVVAFVGGVLFARAVTP